jgi:inhibitor of KinA
MAFPRFLPVADHALLVEFADEIGDEAHHRVRRLDQALAADPPPGMREAVPAYVGLLVDFDPIVTDHRAVEAALRARLARPAAAAPAPGAHVIPVCYDPPFDADLAEVARLCGLSTEDVIAAHLSGEYRVFLYGFAPGYAYLAGVPPLLHLPRKPAPVRDVAAGSVIIAGPQCLITTLRMPTGWWRLGRSPAKIVTGDPARPFLFEVGDLIRFTRIARADVDAAGDAR